MNRSRILILILSLLVVFSLVACGGHDETTAEETTESDIESSSEGTFSGETPAYNVITIAEALALCGDNGNVTTERYYIRGVIETITNAAYGAMVVSDATGSIPVYGTYSSDGSINYSQMDEKPYKGDEVLLYCILQNYNGTKEVKNARLIEFKSNQSSQDISSYTDMTVAEARNAAAGEGIRLDGVVACITYANGMKPSGFMLIDETGSIYIYDQDAAQRVAVGNKVTLAGSKTYWILDTETANAQKFGYMGCNQLESITLIDNDGKTDNAFPKSGITESSVKALLDTPVTEDITTKVYKVNALIKKVPGNGFVNYYLNDIDGETGSYVYTQCNGSDFAWLDAFDGKICTVYLTALNAKSGTTDCFFRFLPVAVYDEGYTFDLDGTAEYAVKYHGVGQFMNVYSADPSLSLLSTVSSELLGFEDALLSYTSSDEEVIAFAEEGGVTVMHCKAAGEVTVTVIGSYGGKTYSETVRITVTVNEEYETVSVLDAVSAEVGETVTVRGIVGPSLVNKSGFYLIDETGVIAIEMTTDQFEGLAIGHEVVLRGTRAVNIKDTTTHCVGQTCIKNGEIVANYYGQNSYATDSFVTDKTLAYIYSLDPMTDYSTTVFVTTATVTVEEAQYYSNIYLTSGSTTLRLYCSSASQYSWLKVFAGQEVTVEVAACNWNDKDYYTGCVLAVITEDGKVMNELNFLN